MKKITAYLFAWDELSDVLQNILDDSGIKCVRDGALYKAFSDVQELDAGQVDERISQYLTIDGMVGYPYEDGVLFYKGE